MLVGSLMKILITIIGLFWTFALVFLALMKKEKSKLKKAGIIIFGTGILLVIIILFEFVILF